MYGLKADTIVGYTFNAATYCPEHIIDALPTGEGEPFDGWALAPGADPMTPEENLNEIAWAFGIARMDETSFDSGEFPKVIFAVQVEDDSERCETCNRALVPND